MQLLLVVRGYFELWAIVIVVAHINMSNDLLICALHNYLESRRQTKVE